MRMLLNTYLYKTVFLILPIIFFSGCYQDVVDVEFTSSGSQLVVEAVVTNEVKQHVIKLRNTSSYDRPEYFEPVSGADVSISDDSGNIYSVTESEAGKYLTESLGGVPGRRYTLSIEYNGKLYESVSSMPEPIQLDSITFNKVDEDINFYELSCFFRDNPGEVNLALIRILKNDIYYEGSDFLYNGNYFDGENIILDDFEEYFALGDEAEVTIYTFDQSSYYIYRHIEVRRNLDQEDKNDDEYDDPGYDAEDLLGMTDFNISNISNNAIGIFSMQNKTSYKIYLSGN